MVNYTNRISNFPEERTLREQYVKDLFSIVVKNFSGVEENEIKIEYSNRTSLIIGYRALNETLTEKEPIIRIGHSFFNSSVCEQMADMAHEIGHHKTEKNYTLPRLKRVYRWNIMYNNPSKFPPSRPHWEQRLKKRNILQEMAADSNTIKTPYGRLILEGYKKYFSLYNQLDETSKKLHAESFEEMEQLAANLEKKLDS